MSYNMREDFINKDMKLENLTEWIENEKRKLT